jgi:hypothetical protein
LHEKLLLESAFLDRANALRPRVHTVKAVEYTGTPAPANEYFEAIIIHECAACQADPADLVYSQKA